MLPPGRGFPMAGGSSPYQTVIDSSTARIAFSLSTQLAYDRIGKENATSLTQNVRIKLFDAAMGVDSSELQAIIESLGTKVDSLFPHTLAMELEHAPPDQLLIVTGVALHLLLPPDIVLALQGFAERGGRILFVNSATGPLAVIFPGKFQPFVPSCTIRAPLTIVGEKDLFSGFTPEEREIIPEAIRYPLKVERKGVKVLAKFESYLGDEPTLVKFDHGQGVIYILVSKMFIAEPKELPKLDQFLQKKGASQTTIAAWECAARVGYKKAVSQAIAAAPFIEMLVKLILKETAAGAQHLAQFREAQQASKPQQHPHPPHPATGAPEQQPSQTENAQTTKEEPVKEEETGW